MSDLIKNYIPKDYSNFNFSNIDTPIKIDCSLGTHYENIPQFSFEDLSETISKYPHDISIYDEIIKKFSDVSTLSPENICLGDGSYNLLTAINLIHLLDHKTLLSYIPHFSAYTDHVNLIGANHVHYTLNRENKYSFDLEQFITLIKSSNASLIFFENPNNPTGQILPISSIRTIVSVANNLKIPIIVDEAYGDYMKNSNSAISLIHEFDNLYVVRSMSKGYRMAGLRIGYCITNKTYNSYLKKFITPFNANSFGRIVAKKLLCDTEYPTHLTDTTIAKKIQLIDTIDNLDYFNIATTSLNTPIMLIYTNYKIDLWRLFRNIGLNTVSGYSFQSLDIDSVRLIVREDTNLISELLIQANDIMKG